MRNPIPPRYAFVHIPKNAGTSFLKALEQVHLIKYCCHDVIFETVTDLPKIYVIREPISRFTSAFFYLKQYKKNKDTPFENPNQLIDGLLKFDQKALDFFKTHHENHTVNGEPINENWSFHPQLDWLIDPYKVMIYENLDYEVKILNRDLGTNIVLEILNDSPKIDFEYSSDNIEFLKLVYKRDFEMYQTYTQQNVRRR